MFRGQFVHNIDAKGRVSMPVRFREALSGAGRTRSHHKLEQVAEGQAASLLFLQAPHSVLVQPSEFGLPGLPQFSHVSYDRRSALSTRSKIFSEIAGGAEQ